jgi:hypothetical protein
MKYRSYGEVAFGVESENTLREETYRQKVSYSDSSRIREKAACYRTVLEREDLWPSPFTTQGSPLWEEVMWPLGGIGERDSTGAFVCCGKHASREKSVRRIAKADTLKF